MLPTDRVSILSRHNVSDIWKAARDLPIGIFQADAQPLRGNAVQTKTLTARAARIASI